MYKLTKPSLGQTESSCVIRLSDNAFIPFDPANTDYQAFKNAVLNQEPTGATSSSGDTFSLNTDPDLSILEDADGVQMPLDQAKTYVATLP